MKSLFVLISGVFLTSSLTFAASETGQENSYLFQVEPAQINVQFVCTKYDKKDFWSVDIKSDFETNAAYMNITKNSRGYATFETNYPAKRMGKKAVYEGNQSVMGGSAEIVLKPIAKTSGYVASLTVKSSGEAPIEKADDLICTEIYLF